VSFKLQKGEVLGIIGRNGSGKTTLLKILSRITEPTTGRVVLRGRVASLLEVGTGFHPELTGRENVYLNGVILGMARTEVKRKFDQIVDFSEVSQFIDTPVKRYSSGMKLRLAFAVAAHLDPEILVIDEVLAVGDMAFQTKCLQKMDSVAHDEGRTILFVSHNMGVIRTLCSTGLYLEKGQVLGQGPVEEQITRYLGSVGQVSCSTDLAARDDFLGSGKARILDVRLTDLNGVDQSTILSGQSLRLEFRYETHQQGAHPQWAVGLLNQRAEKVFHLESEDRGAQLPPLSCSGTHAVSISRVPLPPGDYIADLRLKLDGETAYYLQRAFSLKVEPGDFFGIGRVTPSHGELVYVDHSWHAL